MEQRNPENHVGICALCGRTTVLTFEHIPPRSAFNSKAVKTVSGDVLINRIVNDGHLPWDVDGLHYEQNQRGSGRYSLCADCNNKTGSWYGEEYTKLAHIFANVLAQEKGSGNNIIEVQDIYPLRFIKQILSLFCSINNKENPKMHELRKFVLDKESVGISREKYKLQMYLTESCTARQVDFSIVFRSNDKETKIQQISEISSAPFGFILYFDPKSGDSFKGFDITGLSEFSYDERCTVTFPLMVYEVNSLFPLDYRTKEEILKAFSP